MALKNTVEGFDSNQDDWMSQELRREARISAWDLDNNAGYMDEEHRQYSAARALRRQHEQDCDAQKVRDEHSQIHKTATAASRPNKAVYASAQIATVVFVIMFIFIMLIFFFVFVSIMFRF